MRVKARPLPNEALIFPQELGAEVIVISPECLHSRETALIPEATFWGVNLHLKRQRKDLSFIASFPKSLSKKGFRDQVWLEQTLNSPGMLSVLRRAFEGVGVGVILGTWLLEARLGFGQVSQGRGLDGAVMC